MDQVDRERWRKVNWGYSEEFLQAEQEYLGIAPEPPQLEPSQIEYFIRRLDKQQMEIADLRTRIHSRQVIKDRL